MPPAAAASRQRSQAGRTRVAPLEPSSRNSIDAGTTSPSVVTRAQGGNLASNRVRFGLLLRGYARVQSGLDRVHSGLLLQQRLRSLECRAISTQATALFEMRHTAQAAVSQSVGFRPRRERALGANTCEALERPHHGDPLASRSCVGLAARSVHRPGPAKPDLADWVHTCSASPGVEGDDVVDGPRSSPCPRGLGGARRVPSGSGAPRNPSP
jgi:hypothetical protein